MTYRIYRLKDTEENVRARFMGSESLKKYGLWPINPEAYEMIWEGFHSGFEPERFLDWVYEKFNIDPPRGFKHCSVSVGDIVVLFGRQSGAYICDKIGWTPLPEFFEYADNLED